ncbi:isoaspartyl peptidase/L-asparaginase isoform X1 [Xenopus tropicalis]|uniref:Isoaspartyl peptidase/L-asparaginase n=3 Tax=Xenopus tropicalis TaxID=8364 RepID=A0A8J0SM30_XENTR|nr:isoaspartyl peptidase/L-asparaginase isoform X1 [Xenopus tropicalis]
MQEESSERGRKRRNGAVKQVGISGCMARIGRGKISHAGNMKPVIVVHGGAGKIVKELDETYRLGVKRAVLKGYDVLRQGGSALTAVEEAVIVMEDEPIFNAGHGSVLNEKGYIEMDAIIMDGKNLDSGAVSAVRNIANPIKLARLVMEKTDHMLLTCEGATLFAKAQGIPETPNDTLITERSRKRWMKNLKENSNPIADQIGLGTVGAVAIDCEGNMACATSTGGLTNKMVGRVGDTACIGSGGYADNNVGAVSTTGHGESIMKVILARLILHYMEQGKSPEEAADAGLNYMKSRVEGTGGAIIVNSSGDWTAKFSTNQMSWAAVKDDQLHIGIYHGENNVIPLEKAL